MMHRNSLTTSLRRRFTRRQFLQAAGGGAAGLAGILTAGRPPAYAQTRELTFLTATAFVPEADLEVKRQLEEWGAQNRVRVRFDIIAHLQLAAKKAAEVQARSGHDITCLGPGLGDGELYFDYLVDLDDIAPSIGANNGGWLNESDYIFRGKWKLLPWWFGAYPMAYRTDILEKLGEKIPDTWEDWLQVSKKAKAMGHPIGIPIAHCGDANISLFSMLWCYGASYVAKDGKTIAINSPQTREVLEFVGRLYREAMEPEVLAWDDASNNRGLNAGKLFAIHNPISAYESAKASKIKIPGSEREIHEVIDHVNSPRGPADRKTTSFYYCVGIWNFSKQVDLAKEFLKYHFSPEQQHKFIAAGRGFTMSHLVNLNRHPVYGINPKHRHLPEVAKATVAPAWPGTQTAASQLTWDLFVIPDMFSHFVTGSMTAPQAIEWAERELKEIYAGRRVKKS